SSLCHLNTICSTSISGKKDADIEIRALAMAGGMVWQLHRSATPCRRCHWRNGAQQGGSRISAVPSAPETNRPSIAHQRDAATLMALQQIAKAARLVAYTKLPNRELAVDLHGR